jgi:hypothetical protein
VQDPVIASKGSGRTMTDLPFAPVSSFSLDTEGLLDIHVSTLSDFPFLDFFQGILISKGNIDTYK